MPDYQIDAIHAFTDNFIWTLYRTDSDAAIVVDPGDAAPVQAWLKAHGKRLVAILITHKHSDHVGGLPTLSKEWPEAAICGPADEPIDLLDHELDGGDSIRIEAMELAFDVLDVRGHTEGHIAFYNADFEHDQGSGILFSGDTLFSAGCGRVFSGSFEDLHDALARIRELPASTQVFGTHEYTLDNIGFAKWVEPDNAALLARETQCHEQLEQRGRTLPTTLGEERRFNPFLRVDEPSVIAALQAHFDRDFSGDAARFRALREWKDREYD